MLQPFGQKEVVGLVRFPSIAPKLQNYRLDLNHSDNIINWSKANGEAPDIGFLRIPTLDGKDLEAKGAVFYNLERPRDYAPTKAENSMSKCHAVVGVVAQWTKDTSSKDGKKVDLGGLFGCAKNLKSSSEKGAELVELEIDFAAGPKIPKSYEGISGSALWELHVELDPQKTTVQVNVALNGIAFLQSEDHTRITCNGTTLIDEITKQIKAKWPEG